jgi:solute carrier family 25 phosphate transporter 3
MAKFAVFEVAQEKIIAATGKTKDQLVGSQLTMVNLAGGLVAGMAAAVVSIRLHCAAVFASDDA